jgi:hypothetical protein
MTTRQCDMPCRFGAFPAEQDPLLRNQRAVMSDPSREAGISVPCRVPARNAVGGYLGRSLPQGVAVPPGHRAYRRIRAPESRIETGIPWGITTPVPTGPTEGTPSRLGGGSGSGPGSGVTMRDLRSLAGTTRDLGTGDTPRVSMDDAPGRHDFYTNRTDNLNVGNEGSNALVPSRKNGSKP